MRFGAVVIILLAMVIVPAYLAQSANAFFMARTQCFIEDSDFGKELERINEKFGNYNPLVLLVPGGSIPTRSGWLMN